MEEQEYLALCYTWGPEHLTYPINIRHDNYSSHLLYRLIALGTRSQNAGEHGLDTSLIKMLLKSWDSVCTDQRDIFYALLGLGTEKHQIVIDYNWRAQDIFWDAFTAHHLAISHESNFKAESQLQLGLLLNCLDITGLEDGASRETALCNLYTMSSRAKDATSMDRGDALPASSTKSGMSASLWRTCRAFFPSMHKQTRFSASAAYKDNTTIS
jgi:hypothetical protein